MTDARREHRPIFALGTPLLPYRQGTTQMWWGVRAGGQEPQVQVASQRKAFKDSAVGQGEGKEKAERRRAALDGWAARLFSEAGRDASPAA